MTPTPSLTASEDDGVREALAYLTPHWLTNGPVILDGPKMRAAAEAISASLARLQSDLTAAREERDTWKRRYGLSTDQALDAIRDRDIAEAEAVTLRAQLKDSAMQHMARDLQDEQVWSEVVSLRERVGKLEEVLRGILPGKLCGESWGLPDTERMPIQTTLGALKAARSALSPLQTEKQETKLGATPTGSGSQASPEAPTDPRLAGFDPSRVAPATHVIIYSKRVEEFWKDVGLGTTLVKSEAHAFPYEQACDLIRGAEERYSFLPVWPRQRSKPARAETRSGSVEDESLMTEGQAPEPPPQPKNTTRQTGGEL